MIQTEESEQPFITASVWGLTLLIFCNDFTVITPSEPEVKHCPVILHRDTMKQNSQPQQFTIQNDRKRGKEHYKFLRSWRNCE